MINIGSSIRIARIQRNLNQKELAERSGITDNFLSRIESGTREPSWSTLQAIAKGMGLPLTVLVILSEMEEPLVKPFTPLALLTVLTEARHE